MAKKVQRFQMPGYILGVLDDNVASHTRRVAARGAEISPELERMMWIHDIPEATSVLDSGKDHDITTVEKSQNSQLAHQIEEIELETAKNIFQPSDLRLYQRFERAIEILSSTGQEVVEDALGILGRIIDTSDGNAYFHDSLSKWHNDLVGLDRVNEWPSPGLEFTFKHYHKTKTVLQTLKFKNQKDQGLALKLLETNMRHVLASWAKVSVNHIPEAIKRWL